MARGPKSKSKGAVVGGTVVGGNGTVSGPATVYTAVQNATDLAGAVNTAVQKKIESRPKGTSSSYDPKQKKWASFCAMRKFDDGTIVSEAKLLLWLQTVIVPTGNSRKKERKDAADGTAPAKNASLAASTIETYVSGVLDLYKQQVSLGTNLHTNPRGGALTSYMDSLGREEATRKRDAMDDRQGGTIQDGYSHHIFSRINNHYLAMTTISSNCSRNRLDHLLTHALMLRGETIRGAQLADMFVLPMPNEGAQLCHAVVLITAQGKTNQFGRLEYAGCLRYKNVLECPQSALAIYLFERFQCANEPFPSFARREDWYRIYLLKHQDLGREVPVTYRMQYDNMCKVL
ncbi:hypothetical protein A4X06_0g2613, partial [Tilletia controversa]